MFGKPADEMLKALRRLQDCLGAQQDAHTAKNRLASIVADPGSHLPADTVFLMGRLAEHHVKETARARKDLARAWRKVRGRRWKALSAKMQEVSEKSAAVRCETSADRRGRGRARSCPGSARSRARVRAADRPTLAAIRPHGAAAHPARHRLRT